MHISQAIAKHLGYGDTIEQGGVTFRVSAITGYTNGFGWNPETVWLVPTHNADGDPMPSDADVYTSRVHVPSGTLSQARWFGPQHVAAARLQNETTKG